MAGNPEARRRERDNDRIEDLGVGRGQSTTHDGRLCYVAAVRDRVVTPTSIVAAVICRAIAT
jgi:hypothetical protein